MLLLCGNSFISTFSILRVRPMVHVIALSLPWSFTLSSSQRNTWDRKADSVSSSISWWRQPGLEFNNGNRSKWRGQTYICHRLIRPTPPTTAVEKNLSGHYNFFVYLLHWPIVFTLPGSCFTVTEVKAKITYTRDLTARFARESEWDDITSKRRKRALANTQQNTLADLLFIASKSRTSKKARSESSDSQEV